MIDSVAQYDPSVIAKQVLADDMCREIVAFQEKQRRIGYAGLTSLCIGAALLFGGSLDEYWLLAGIGCSVIGVMIFCSKWSIRRKFFREKLIPLLVNSISPSLKYSPYKGLARTQFERFKLFGAFDRYHSEDQIKGMIGKTAVQISEVHVEERHRSKNRNDSYTTVFRGVVFVADFNKHFKCRTVVLPDMAERLFGKLLGNFLQQMNFSETGKLIKLENVEFEKKFVVYSTDQLEARYILTPQLMERLLAVQTAETSSIRVLFEDNNIVITIPRADGWLEPPFLGRFDRLDVLAKTVQEIITVVKLVEDLDLNTRIWTKQ